MKPVLDNVYNRRHLNCLGMQIGRFCGTDCTQ